MPEKPYQQLLLEVQLLKLIQLLVDSTRDMLESKMTQLRDNTATSLSSFYIQEALCRIERKVDEIVSHLQVFRVPTILSNSHSAADKENRRLELERLSKFCSQIFPSQQTSQYGAVCRCCRLSWYSLIVCQHPACIPLTSTTEQSYEPHSASFSKKPCSTPDTQPSDEDLSGDMPRSAGACQNPCTLKRPSSENSNSRKRLKTTGGNLIH